MSKSRGLIALVALVVSAAWSLPVFAHAALLAATPPANASLETAPAQIELLFTEPLEPSFSSITVLNSEGAQVDSGDVRVDPAQPARLTVSLRSLPDGVYTVSWKALSTADGHITTGSYPFSVGAVEAGALAEAGGVSRATRISLLEIVARWLSYLALAALSGGTLFILAVWTPAAAALASPDWRRPAAIALGAFAVASALSALTQAGQASGAEMAPPWSPVLGTLLSNTRYGALWLARLSLLLALTALLLRAQIGPPQRWLALGLCALALLTISLGSHAAAEPDPALPVLVDWVHLGAASVWVGGLSHFLLALWSLRGARPDGLRAVVAGLIRRFSAVALMSVGVLVLTGVYSAAVQLGAWPALTSTVYGQALLVKLLIALPMVGLGAFNLLVVSRAMARPGAAGLITRFQRAVTGEVGLSVALLLSVGVLTAIPPANSNAQPPMLSATRSVDDLSVTMEVAPGRIGVNDFRVMVASNGAPLADAREVEVQFTPESGKLPPNKSVFPSQGEGRYGVRGSYFSLPDRWQVRVAVRRAGRFDTYAQFNFDVGTASAPVRWGLMCAVLLALAAVAFVWMMRALGGELRGMRALPAIGLLAAAAFVTLRPPTTEIAGPVNPIPPNEASISAGQQLYLANCLPCHGLSGKGDGPVGITLNPRPSDLSQHAVPGVHTDGQLYEWITYGYPGSVMPAFKAKLSDEQRWHLVNYLREGLRTTR
jgi:copper transport protein